MKSKYKGVVWVERNSKWWARYQAGPSKVDLGFFESEHEAAIQICKVRIEAEQLILKAAEAERYREISAARGKKLETNVEKFLKKAIEYVHTPDVAEYATRNPGTAMSGL